MSVFSNAIRMSGIGEASSMRDGQLLAELRLMPLPIADAQRQKRRAIGKGPVETATLTRRLPPAALRHQKCAAAPTGICAESLVRPWSDVLLELSTDEGQSTKS